MTVRGIEMGKTYAVTIQADLEVEVDKGEDLLSAIQEMLPDCGDIRILRVENG